MGLGLIKIVRSLPQKLGLRTSTVAVLLDLAAYADEETRLAWPSHETIAGDLNMSAKSVKNALSELINAGLVHRVGWNERRKYYLALERCQNPKYGKNPTGGKVNAGQNPTGGPPLSQIREENPAKIPRVGTYSHLENQMESQAPNKHKESKKSKPAEVLAFQPGTDGQPAAFTIEETQAAAIVWPDMLDQLQERIDEESMATWFGAQAAKPVAVKGDRLVIQAATKFTANWLRNNFYEVVAATASELLGRDIELEITEGEIEA